MPLHTDDATAIVRFTGLGVLCLSNDQNNDPIRAENLFIHEEGHELTLEIFQPVPDGTALPGHEDLAQWRMFQDDPTMGAVANTWYERIAVYENLDYSRFDSQDVTRGVTIDITGGNTQVSGYQKWDSSSSSSSLSAPPPFTRLNNSTASPNDPNDFGWIVNISQDGLLGGASGPGCQTFLNDRLASRLFITNALLYTAKLTGEDEFYQVSRVIDPTTSVVTTPSTPIQRYGKMAEEIGARLDGSTVEVIITVGNQVNTHPLPRLDKPYIILIKNNASVANSDMEIYRSLWGAQTYQDLFTQEEIDYRLALNGAVTGREICNGIYTECPGKIQDFFTNNTQ